jgi:hypothetical protein
MTINVMVTHHVGELRDFGATQHQHVTRAAFPAYNARSLLDHLVGGGEQLRWDSETKRFGRL